MKKLLVFVLVAIIILGCSGSSGKESCNPVYDGHNYKWIMSHGFKYLVHSLECDSCKTMRKQEIKELIEEIKK